MFYPIGQLLVHGQTTSFEDVVIFMMQSVTNLEASDLCSSNASCGPCQQYPMLSSNLLTALLIEPQRLAANEVLAIVETCAKLAD